MGAVDAAMGLRVLRPYVFARYRTKDANPPTARRARQGSGQPVKAGGARRRGGASPEGLTRALTASRGRADAIRRSEASSMVTRSATTASSGVTLFGVTAASKLECGWSRSSGPSLSTTAVLCGRGSACVVARSSGAERPSAWP